MCLGKRGRREGLGRRARKIHLPFTWLRTALDKLLAGRNPFLRRPKLHDAYGREEHLAWATYADEGTVRRHGLARIACVDDAPAVSGGPLDKGIEECFFAL
jgi:hypothetical protein